MFAFRWKDGVTEQQKQRTMEGSRALMSKILGLLEVWVGKNISPRGQGFEHSGVVRFANNSALEVYGAHPEHQKLVSRLMLLVDP